MILLPDSNFHEAHMGPTWVLSVPGGPHVGPMNLVIRVIALKFDAYRTGFLLIDYYLRICLDFFTIDLCCNAVQSNMASHTALK